MVTLTVAGVIVGPVGAGAARRQRYAVSLPII